MYSSLQATENEALQTQTHGEQLGEAGKLPTPDTVKQEKREQNEELQTQVNTACTLQLSLVTQQEQAAVQMGLHGQKWLHAGVHQAVGTHTSVDWASPQHLHCWHRGGTPDRSGQCPNHREGLLEQGGRGSVPGCRSLQALDM